MATLPDLGRPLTLTLGTMAGLEGPLFELPRRSRSEVEEARQTAKEALLLARDTHPSGETRHSYPL